ncbi:MAG: hypothetical protein H0V89_09410, partial [Deltaproteobacteria bacterium]|nr:hypothetical protein [Deltaproteobacteria bacterium]
RGNKRVKPDLESVVALDGRLVGLPSGSAPGRDQLAVDAAWLDGRALYDTLRALVPGELNVEGARLDGSELWLFNRGNGAIGSIDARIVVDRGAFAAWLGGGPAPVPRLAETWDLGALHGVRLSFTDVTDDGPALFSAAAEASPNAVDDGAVLGIAVGRLEDGGWTEIEEAGAPISDKIEGLTWLDGVLWACTDPDDPDRPGELLEIALGGRWR